MAPLFRASLISLFLTALFGATEIPSIAPQVSSIFPHGGRQGSQVGVAMTGAYLDGATAILFHSPSLHGKIESATFRSILATISIAANAEAGRHEFRIVTPRGAWFGMFWVGTLAEAEETEPNGTPTEAQAIVLPVLINGRADGSDADYYRFRAQAGETIVFDVTATRLGSSLDPVLTLFDASGREIGYNDDAYAFKDARLVHRFDRTGDYFLLVSASFERSGRDAEYRLLATGGPFGESSLPLGGRRGAALEATIYGWNLDRVDRVWLGSHSDDARIVARKPGHLKVRLTIPESTQPGTHYLRLAAEGTESPAPLRFEVGELPEVTAGEESATASRPAYLSSPVVVNGRIPGGAERIQRAQWFEFEASAGDRYEFRVDGWRLGQRIDPVITLIDAQGTVLLQEDDPAPNSFIHHPASHDPRMVYLFDKPGRYRVQLRDAAYEGDASYRLTITRTRPDFEVEVRSPQLTVYSGRQVNLLTIVRRTGGVHRVEGFRKADSEIEHFRLIEKDGWREPITVWIEGLPEGVTAKRVVAEPRNTVFKGNDGEELFVDGSVVEIPVQAADGMPGGLHEIRVRASGSHDGEKAEREAAVLTGFRAYRLERAAEQKLYLNVVAAPPVLWNAPLELRISKGETEMLRAGIVRLRGSFPVTVEAKTALPGFIVGRATADAATEKVEVPVTALDGAASQPAQLVLVAAFEQDGRRERVESPPIEVRSKP